MAGSTLPKEVLRVIEAGEGPWSTHAMLDGLRLGLYWSDVVQVARTATTWKRERDEKGEAVDGFKDSVQGRDCHGRRLLLAGKKVYFERELRWYIITFHEAH
ncbi:MAG: hypothetical protein HY814_15480 [Candidatus Riflebacteria bacterium]|nr:hypothetical protein [Candidatus Riflebacteria bacterium]